MSPLREFARRLRRWDLLLVTFGLLAPIAASLGLGMLWLVQQGGLLIFVLLATGLNAAIWCAVFLGRRIIGRRAALDATTQDPELDWQHVEPDPEWSAQDNDAFKSAKVLIAQRVREPIPWAEFQSVAQEVLEVVAKASPGERTVFDFTVPEALLLLERASSRSRDLLRHNVPFSDSLTLRHGLWIWERRELLRATGSALKVLRHGYRLATNLPAGLVGVLDAQFGAKSQGLLSSEGLATLQALLLEEIAYAAVELYSGRLRFSDSELLEMQLAETGRFRSQVAKPDVPPRVIIAGQVSAGKSSLINALAGVDLTESDVSETTTRNQAFPVELRGIEFLFVDTPGLDGSVERETALLAELQQADLVLWVLRGDRPSRAPDQRAMNAWSTAAKAQVGRRAPPVIGVITAIDRLTEGWPHLEHQLTEAANQTVTAVASQIEAELGLTAPVVTSLVDPEWNISTVVDRISGALPDTIACQRNRIRLAAETSTMGQIIQETGRAGRGLTRGLSAVTRSAWQRGSSDK